MKKEKTLRERIIEKLEEFNSIIAGLNLNWAEKIKGKIDYEKYVCPREEKRIEQFADQILELAKEDFKRVVEEEINREIDEWDTGMFAEDTKRTDLLDKVKNRFLKAIEEL